MGRRASEPWRPDVCAEDPLQAKWTDAILDEMTATLGRNSEARRYLDELAAQSLTRQIDEALLAAGDDDTGAAAAAAGLDW